MKKASSIHSILVCCLALLSSCGKQIQSPEPQKMAKTTNGSIAGNDERANDDLRQSMTERHQYVELILHNSNEADIDETAVVFGKYSCTFGIVGAKVSAGHLGWQGPVRTNVLVRWRDSGKTDREAQVDISTTYIRDVPGRLTFTIMGTNVTVDFKKLDRK